MERNMQKIIIRLTLVAACGMLVWLPQTSVWADDTSQAEKTALASSDDSTMLHARALSRAFRNAAQRALPSVVTVFSRSQRPNEQSSVLDIIGGENEQRFDSVGSGVIVTGDGLILTNHHVIKDAAQIEVRLADGRQFTATESKSDPKSDVAIVMISVDEALPAAEIGNSNELFVGDWVLAIGSPFTLESSVSAGIISGTGRMQQLSRMVSGQFLQTDAAINPGNSGGPLVDLDGRVVGINTAISSRTGGFEGIGFAIPIARAIWIKKELLEFGSVRRGYVGLGTSNVPYEVAKQLNLPRNAGAMVSRVVPNYPGDKAGVLIGDVVVEFGGGRVESAGGFAEIVQQSPIGEPLKMIILREGERRELDVQLEERK
jgi:serine protease Do